MSLPALATIDDVELVPGYPADSNEDTVDALLALASARVRKYTGCNHVDEDGALSGVPDGVPELVAGMVVRSLRNPRGVTQESAGPFGASYGREATNSIYLSAADKEFLDSLACRLSVWTLATTRGDLDTPAVRDPFECFDDGTNPYRW